jgi:hypothetical protein
VDSTNILTWAEETSDLPGVVGTEKMENKHYAHQTLSGQAVSDGLPIQFGHNLQLENCPMHKQLSDLLDTIEARLQRQDSLHQRRFRIRPGGEYAQGLRCGLRDLLPEALADHAHQQVRRPGADVQRRTWLHD